MNLKKQMEKDLEELKKQLKEVKEKIDDLQSYYATDLDSDYSKISGKIEIIEKYLKEYRVNFEIEKLEKLSKIMEKDIYCFNKMIENNKDYLFSKGTTEQMAHYVVGENKNSNTAIGAIKKYMDYIKKILNEGEK